MKIIKLNQNNLEKLFNKIGSTQVGTKILLAKSKLHFFHIHQLKTPAANILKQDALSIGADLVVPKSTICCDTEFVDAILIASTKQLKELSKKEKAQPFGLKTLALKLEQFLNPKTFKTRIMGVINLNEDSFFDASRTNNEKAIVKIQEMIQNGANIIDIGAVSSKPGSKAVNETEEMSRLKPILDSIKKLKLYEKVDFSLDTYSPICASYALECGFKIINDITGLQNDKLASLIAQFDATLVLMHMQNNPTNMQENPTYENIILEIEEFFKERIAKAKEFGIKNIVLDVGIGFGKTLEHNLLLIKHLEHFKLFGYELLIGASRKSMIDMISPTPTSQRLPATLAIHIEAVKNGASILRVHDVKEHKQAIEVLEAFKKVNTPYL